MLAPRCDSAVSVILLQRSGWGRRQVGGQRWRGWRLLWASPSSASSLSGSCTVLTCLPPFSKPTPAAGPQARVWVRNGVLAQKGPLGARRPERLSQYQLVRAHCSAGLFGVVLASAPSFPPFSLSPVQSSQYIDLSAQRRQRTFLSIHNVYVSTSALDTFFGQCF